MVRHARERRGIWLCREDGNPLVNLEGVRTDDLRTEPLSQIDGKRGFPDARRSREVNNCRLWISGCQCAWGGAKSKRAGLLDRKPALFSAV